jgi:hypothetical protein
MDHTYTRTITKQQSVSQSILSKKSSAIIIIFLAINHIVISISQFGNVLYYFNSKARASELKVLERELKNKREKEKSHSC